MTPEDKPVTVSELRAAEQRIKDQNASELRAAEQRIKDQNASELRAAEQRIKDQAVETARELQTEILRGLEAFARGNFARFHSLESNQTDVNIRLAALEERVLYLETRGGGRPPQ